MLVKIELEGETATAFVTVRIDESNADDMLKKLLRVGETVEYMVLDLNGTGYISMEGLGTLIRLHVFMEKKGGLVLRNVNRRVRFTLKDVMLPFIFRIID